MRVPVSWLRAHVDPGLSAEEIADVLTMSGVKLERLHRVGVGDPAEFVVGKVLACEQHPDADRLSVCEVDVGAEQPSTIVCGAPNVAAGQTVAVARPGAVMPDGTTLGEAKLRGVKSSGMILAEDELGISEQHGGIMVLADGLPAGAPLSEHLPIADEVLELEITPNRADAMGVYGVARDVHAVTAAPLGEDPTARDAQASGSDSAEDHASVEIDPEICLRFTARVFEDVTIGESPAWLKQRLMAAGQRPISNVVDITNYVMLESGQPLHAFDLDEVRGARIVVRRAHEGETMTTLDDVERRLTPEAAVVGDAEGPSGIAGIMGGQISEVSDSTTRILMEAATWVGPNIMRTSKALGLRSEASARFEKQLHPEQAIAAQRLAARLMVELTGARLVPGTIDVYPAPAPPRVVPLRRERIERLLGELPPDDVVDGILGRLGFEWAGDGWRVPSWRDSDVQREADLIEEVARVYGLDKLPTTLPARKDAIGRLTPSQRLRRRLEDVLRDRGLLEAIAYSFTSDAALADLRLADVPVLRIDNPLSEDQSVLRPLLLPGLLDAAKRNAAHGRPGVALFESAHVYGPDQPLDPAPADRRSGGPPAVDSAAGRGAEGLGIESARGRAGGEPDAPPAGAGPDSPGGRTPARERQHLAALITEAAPPGWRSEARPADFFAAKALVETLLESAGVVWRADPKQQPFLHPGRAAAIVSPGAERTLGWIGELHPLVADAWELPRSVAGFELDLDALIELSAGHVATHTDVTTFPAVLQDIAVVVPDTVSAAEVEAAVRTGGGELLRSVRVFDLYRGDQVGEGSKSLALRLEFRAPDRTLTDDDVVKPRSVIEQRLAEIGGRLRA